MAYKNGIMHRSTSTWAYFDNQLCLHLLSCLAIRYFCTFLEDAPLYCLYSCLGSLMWLYIYYFKYFGTEEVLASNTKLLATHNYFLFHQHELRAFSSAHTFLII